MIDCAKPAARETDGGLSLVDDPHLSAASAGPTPRTREPRTDLTPSPRSRSRRRTVHASV